MCLCVQNEFRDYPPVLRHAVSVARRLQDPLIEFASLCNPDEDILCLKYHPLQVIFFIIFLSNNNNIFKMILRVLSWGTFMSLFYNVILFLSSSSRIVCQKMFCWMLSTLNSSTVSMKSGLMLTKPLTTTIMPPCFSLFVALDPGKGPILLGFVFSV